MLSLIWLRPRCSMFMFITDDPKVLNDYLDVRGARGLFSKTRKHLFLTSNELVKDAVYSNEEFQYHGHAGCYFSIYLLPHFHLTSLMKFTLPVFYRFDRVSCLEDYNDLIDYNDVEIPTRIRCSLFGYYFDTFESFKPILFTAIEALPEVGKERNSSLINKVYLVFPCLRLQGSLPRWMFIRISYLTWRGTPTPWPLYHIFHLYGRKEKSTLA